ncbi:MAG: diphosphomevalonate decarboxylase [Anaerolineae bacterium]|nr:diphosphomevalonate decarboxylase [Anaerolineae bacterium]
MRKQASAEAPANLAFVKYWGKKNSGLRLPANNSISVNLSQAKTSTTIIFDSDFEQDRVILADTQTPAKAEFTLRVSEHLDRLRKLAGAGGVKALVQTQNSFPSGVGIASSASGFAALTTAASAALGLPLDPVVLSSLARLGSGSACRSIPDGFCEWLAGNDDNSSYAVQVAPPDHWDLRILTVVVSEKTKKLSSTDGHALAAASPFFEARLADLPDRLNKVRAAIVARDFKTFGQETEKEAVSFHTIAMTSPIQTADGWFSGAYYWLPESLEIMLAVQNWRAEGLPVYFTLDAGPTVHLICLEQDVETLKRQVKMLENARPGRNWTFLTNAPAIGARVLA